MTNVVEQGAAGIETRSKWAALSVLALAQLMVVLDTTIVNVALPSIQRKLHFHSAADLQWVVNIYVLTAGGFLLLGGRVADRYGRRLVFVAGTFLFAAASLACGLANSSALLVAARAVQGLGSAFMAPAALSLLTVIFAEGEERNRALGVWSAIAGAGGAIGLLAGGVLTTELSWRWIFFVNLPIATFAALATLRLIGESRDPVAGGFDVPGAVTGTAGLGALVFALVRANVWGWGSAKTLSVLAAAVVLLGVFVVLQLKVRDPLVPPRLFRSRNLVGADVGMLIAGAGIFAVFFFLTLYMQNVLHYSALKTGVAYLPLSVMLVVSAGASSNILARVGTRPLLLTSFVLAAAGMLLLARTSPRTGYLDILWPLLLMGVGMGGTFVSVTTSAVAGVPQEDTGVASALLNASQQLGGSLGLAALTAVATARFDAVRPHFPTPATLASADTSSWAYAFVAGAGLLIGAAIIGGLLIRPNPAEPHPGELTPIDESIDRPVEGAALLAAATAVPRASASPSPGDVVRDMARCGCHG
ncbi:MAG TPA: MFS transporter [Acidimicrobiales bacterium]|nr:MFS transporter [Acidimicrobiales bacterium]